MKKTIQPVVIGVIRLQNKYLLTKRRDESNPEHNLWQLPGGGVEFRESLENCLKREIKEETGITLTSYKLIPKIFTVTRKHWHGLLIPFLSCFITKPENIILDHEASDYGWYTLDEVRTLGSLGYTIEIIEEAELMTSTK